MPQQTVTQVFQCGGVLTYQLLGGREFAQDDPHALSSKNYVYLIVNTHDRTAIGVDAAWDIDGLYKLAALLGVTIRGSIYTHFHFDHCGGSTFPLTDAMMDGRQNVPGAKELNDKGGFVWAGSDDVARLKKQCNVEVVRPLHDGDVVDCGDMVLHILHTPGHSPGSICVFAAPRCISPRNNLGDCHLEEKLTKAESGFLLTGDTLFIGACGRTDIKDHQDPKQMARSLSRLATMDPAVVVLPGHNYHEDPFTTIGRERAGNASVQHGIDNFPKPPPLPPCFVCEAGLSCGPAGFKIGRKLRIKGLESEQGRALNGQYGVLESFVAHKTRYAVRLISASESKVLKPENLESAHGTLAAHASREDSTVEKTERQQLAGQTDLRNQDFKHSGEAKPSAAESSKDADGHGTPDLQTNTAAIKPVHGQSLAPLFDGAISLECGESGARPWRLPHEQKSLFQGGLAAIASCASVRMVFRSESQSVRLVASKKRPTGIVTWALEQIDPYPLEYELFSNGSFFIRKRVEAKEGQKHVVEFQGLPEGVNDLELWLPSTAAVVIHGLDCSGELPERPLTDQRPIMLCHGSSITHGGPMSCTSSGSWPAVCSRLANLRLINLGFGGECFLDQIVARSIRETVCACIVLEIGVNVHFMTALTERTFQPAVVGFIQTIREGHENVPIVVVSPIFCSKGEKQSPLAGPRFLTLVQMREALRSIVNAMAKLGDRQLFYYDGLELLGQAEAERLFDSIHPDAQGHLLMGQRFATFGFGPSGRMLPGRLPLDSTSAFADIKASVAHDVPVRDLVGRYVCKSPGQEDVLMVVKLHEGKLVAVSQRKDWPPTVLYVRADLVYLREAVGCWGRVESGVIAFNNGITWIRKQ